MNTSFVQETQVPETEQHHSAVFVRVITTSGAFPHKGEERVSEKTIVDVVLQETAAALHLTDTTGWIALVDGHAIDTSRSFVADGLTGTVVIHWGPPEGGGGR
jgi:hypothetical protein